jgi:aspartate racemase
MKTLGIVAHSVEGASLCYVTACRHAGRLLGEFMHPDIVLSSIPMGLSMPAWESGEHAEVGRHLARGVRTVAATGADFFICPDNTAHIVLEQIVSTLPIPGLHIAHVVCDEIDRRGFRGVGLLGTKWTMTGTVYERALCSRGMTRVIPDEALRARINRAIFEELCHGVVTDATTDLFLGAVDNLKTLGAECVILGCTEIPLVVTPENSSLPTMDSTRLLARRAVDMCITEKPLDVRQGWIQP